MDLPGLNLRLKSQAANLGIKIICGDIESNSRSTIGSFLHINDPRLRYTRLFQHNRNLPQKSPIEIIMHFQGVISLDKSPATNKLLIKKKMAEEQRI